jgi:hypothetical protein
MIGIEQIKKTVISKSGFTQDMLNDTISLHFRLGDYKKIQHYHPIMTYEYYKKSLTFFKIREKLKNNVLYFCEEEDIEHVNEIITNRSFYYIYTCPDFVMLAIITPANKVVLHVFTILIYLQPL